MGGNMKPAGGDSEMINIANSNVDESASMKASNDGEKK